MAGIEKKIAEALDRIVESSSTAVIGKRQGNPVGAAAWLIWDRCLALV
jgi:hypothetical protein